jgi:hypothetical protein
MGELDVLGRREKRDFGAEESVLVPPPVRRTNQENVRYASHAIERFKTALQRTMERQRGRRRSRESLQDVDVIL